MVAKHVRFFTCNFFIVLWYKNVTTNEGYVMEESKILGAIRDGDTIRAKTLVAVITTLEATIRTEATIRMLAAKLGHTIELDTDGGYVMEESKILGAIMDGGTRPGTRIVPAQAVSDATLALVKHREEVVLGEIVTNLIEILKKAPK